MTDKQEQIHKLIEQISYSIDKDPAKKLIPLFYSVAVQIKEKLPDEINQQSKAKQSNLNNDQLLNALNFIHQKFHYFKNTREDQLSKINQVQSYMVQETDQIIMKKVSLIIKSGSVNINDTSRSQIFLMPQTYHLQEDFTEHNQQEYSHKQLQYIAKKYSKTIKVQTKPTIQDCCSIWKNVLKYYEDHRIDQAYAQVERFQSYLYMNDRCNKLKKQHIDLIETIGLEYRTMKEFYQNYNEKGYTFDKEDNGIKCWFKIIGQRNVAIRIQAEVQIPIDHFLSIATQIDLFEQYIPFTYDTKQLKNLSRNERIGTSKVYIPLLTDRQTYFYAAAYNRLKTKGSIFFFSKTINEDKFYQKKYGFDVPQKSNLIRLDYNFYLIQYFPLSKTKGKVRLATSIDLKMDYLPMFIITKSARVFSFDYFKNMIRMNKKFKGSKWQKKVIQKKQLYNFFKDKIDQYMDEIDKQGHQKNLPPPPSFE